MKRLIFGALTALAALSAQAATPTVRWEIIPQQKGEKKYYERFTILNAKGYDRICFNRLPTGMRAVSPGDTLIQLVAGYYAIESPQLATSDSVTVTIENFRPMRSISNAPEAFHAIDAKGRVHDAKWEIMPMIDAMKQSKAWQKWTVSTDSVYKLNAMRADGKQPGVYDIVPSFKKVTPAKGKYTFDGDPSKFKTKITANDRPGYTRIEITPKGVDITGTDRESINQAAYVLANKVLKAKGNTVPCAVIEDWPDFGHRGIMIDIARNFQTPSELKKLIDQMALLRLNRLHLHFSDDEGWRIEIAGFPELTEVGAHRGYTTDDADFLKQVYCGDGRPDTKGNTSNGYWTRAEFIDFLRYCKERGIQVLPEVETPGHARAAIKALEARYRRSGDDTYRLIIPGDTSKYRTAQWYTDNLMNPAAPGVYRFLDAVFDDLVAMYAEADATLPGIHIGGDEVPDGAWDGSAEAVALANKHNVSGRHGLHGVFVKRMAEMLKSKNIPMYGWQEIFKGYDDDFHREVAPAVGGTNCWVTNYDPEKNVALKGVKGGYPVILSNVHYFYVDLMYEPHPEEAGLNWGGYVDEFTSLSGYADNICPPVPDAPGNVIGVQAQLWSETIRDPQMFERAIFPKAVGMAERAWNSTPTYSDADFNAVIEQKEMPVYDGFGIEYHMRRPGITVSDGKVMMNKPYEGGTIYYTTDGTVPTEASPVYTAPFAADGLKEVRAIYILNGKKSVQSVRLM